MRNKNLFDKITDDKSIIEKTYSSHYEYDKTLDFGMSNKTNKLENINLIAITAMTKFLDKSLEEIRVDDYRLKRKEITTEFLKKVKKIIPMENIFYSGINILIFKNLKIF